MQMKGLYRSTWSSNLSPLTLHMLSPQEFTELMILNIKSKNMGLIEEQITWYWLGL